MTDITFDVNFSGGTLVFETEPIENYSPTYETPETFTIVVSASVYGSHFKCF
jgi:hypothetical protein